MILQTRLHTVTLHSHRSRRIVRPAYWPTCIRLLPCLFLTACGGGNTVTSPPPPTTTIRTFESGSLVYLEADTGSETARVGLETQWGGTVVEVSLNGTNFVNQFDAGREVQVAFYDGNQKYDACAGCTGIFGWDPVQGGDRYSHGSPVLEKTVASDSIYVKTQPYEWYPDDKGGGPTQPVPSDVLIEQWLGAVPGHSRAFKLHYKITHFGGDQHANATQEFPAVYVNLGYDRFVYYGGIAPWTNGPVSITSMPQIGAASQTKLCSPERWGAFVNGQDIGLTVFIPPQYPYVGAGFSFTGTTGPKGSGTDYFAPFTSFTFGPNSLLEGDIFLFAGDYKDARQAIYDIKSTLSTGDVFTPFGYVDVPQPGAQISGAADIAGWAFDDAAVSEVDVFMDGAAAGTATYGLSRPDVATVFPHAPVNLGFDFRLDTTRYPNGLHVLTVKVLDVQGNVASFPDVAVNIVN